MNNSQIGIEQLKENIEVEIAMVREMYGFFDRLDVAGDSERRIFVKTIESLKKRTKIINDSVLDILWNVSIIERLPTEPRFGEESKARIQIEPIQIDSAGKKIFVKSEDKESFLSELNISKELIKKIKKRKKKIENLLEIKKTSYYASLSNKFFLQMSERMIRNGYFKSLSSDLKKSNMNVLTATYVSMTLFSVVLSFAFSFFLVIFLGIFNVSFAFPPLALREGNFFLGFIKFSWLIITIPVFVGAMFMLYPGAEKRSLAKKINQELPFVVIHMASISGSGIEPNKIFSIIAVKDDYKYSSKEFKKVINQTNVYGYDLTNALKNVAQTTPSIKLAELLNGISVTITSGGDISLFFEKRAESLLLEYRLEREKFTKTTETFMDIYISIVIAAPMILLMLLIMISVSGLQTGFNVNELTFAIMGIIVIINILFLTFIHFKQPAY